MRPLNAQLARSPWVYPAVLLVLAAGLGVRLLGLRLGLPDFHHWDECWVIWSARHMLETNSDVPTTYQYGAPLSLLVRWMVNIYNAMPGLAPIRFSDEVSLRWVGRNISIVICSMGIFGLFIAGKNISPKLGNQHRLGLYSAAAYAFAYELVTHARYCVTDGILVALCAWSIGFGSQYLRTNHMGWALASLVAAATAFAFKITALPIVIIPFLCILSSETPTDRERRLRYRVLWVGALPFVLAWFLALNPHFIDRWQQASSDLSQRIAQTRNGWFSQVYVHEPGIDHLGAALRLLLFHTMSRVVPLACLLSTAAIFGVILALCQRSKIIAICIVHAALTVAGLAFSARACLLRNYLTAVPVMCLGVGIALEAGSSAFARLGLERRTWRTLGWLIPSAVLVLAAGVTARDSMMNQELSQDARVRAMDWTILHSHAPHVNVSVTPNVMAPPALSNIQSAPAKSSISYLGQLSNCNQVQAIAPDYVISASYRGPDTPKVPFDERWYFTECPRYRRVAHLKQIRSRLHSMCTRLGPVASRLLFWPVNERRTLRPQ